MARKMILAGSTGFCAAILAAVLFILPARAAAAQASTSNPATDQQAQASTTQPKLAGTWKLNEKQSDDPREKMRAAMNANGGSAPMNRGRMGNRPGRGPDGRGGMMRQFSQLTITQLDKGVNVTGATGRLIATSEAQPDDSQNAQDNGGMMMRMPPAKAKWQGSELIATSEGFGGGTVTRTFELSPDGKQLYMTTKIENPRFSEPVTYRLVYDPAKADTNSQ